MVGEPPHHNTTWAQATYQSRKARNILARSVNPVDFNIGVILNLEVGERVCQLWKIYPVQTLPLSAVMGCIHLTSDRQTQKSIARGVDAVGAHPSHQPLIGLFNRAAGEVEQVSEETGRQFVLPFRIKSTE